MRKLNSLGHLGTVILKLLGSIIVLEILVLVVLQNQISTLRPAFIDVLDESGIKREKGLRGASWADYDNDGYLDLLLGGNTAKLYRNNGNGTFKDVTKKTGISSGPTIMGVLGDYDNDGCPDLYLTAYGPLTDRLYHNNCNGTFTDITQKAGIKKESYNGFGAAWADYDNDGYLDLYVANYGTHLFSETKYISEPNILYHNNRNGTFTDVIQKSGVSGVNECELVSNYIPRNATIIGPHKESFQPIWFDYNNDGKIDLFIATDRGVSPLYKNNGNGTFSETTSKAGLCRLGTGMGVTVGDYNDDGSLDIYVTNFGANYLWRNNGNGTFSELAAETQMADPLSISWGAGFFDYDNDSNLDLYVVNGAVPYVDGKNEGEFGKIKLDKLYRNQGDGTFLDVAEQEGINGDYSKGAAAFGDYNNDGFTDMIITTNYLTENNSQVKLYKNQGNKNHWLTIQLVGTKSNRDSVGARIRLTASGKTQIREVISGSSFISQNSLWQTFGLGKSKVVDKIEIRWPSGIKQVVRNIKTNQKVVITEGDYE